MQFCILGPLDITDGERRVEIAAPKQRLLFTVLALSPGQVVSADQLMGELWGEHLPSGGLKTLHYHVSKLRDTLHPGRAPGEEGVIVTRPPGYSLMVSPEDVDAARFAREVQDARRLIEFDPGHAAARLQDALALWRGPLPDELLDAPRSGLEARRLEELRLSALEDRIGADMAAGRHVEVVPELEALVAEHPLRERLWAQYMVALYRSDRQAEALRAYQALRTHLGEEMGIEPSPDLRRLEDSILQQDPELDVPETLQRPTSLRGYELRELVGEGAFGFVWRASQVSVGREVAVKVVRPEHSNRPGSVLGFQAQAHLLASLEHPHVVPVFDFWRDPDGAYLVMPLMAGGSLETTDTTTWETSRVVETIEQIASGLAHAHRLGYVHADLHPGNVLFDAEGNAYLADFGLATNLSAGTSTPPTRYSSPEQIRGEAADPTTDVFALGRLVHRTFTGVDPGRDPLPGVRSVRPDVREAVDSVLRRATHRDAARRHRDAGDFLEDFHRALGREPVPIGEPRNPYKGLRAFTEADAADFFGRDDLVDELVGAVAERRLVAVVGPSGSGKSSLVRAGLVPGLRAGRVPGSDQWLFADLYPGADPFTALAEALRSVAIQPVPHPSRPEWDSGQVAEMVRSALPPGAELVLIVDQFEELFTICSVESERQRFMDVLLALTGDPDSPMRVVLTVRADYYGLPLEHRPFGDALRRAMVAVTPPGPEQLTRAIIGPAEAVGVTVEPQLAADIAGDVSAQPGGLPLMEHALARLFEDRTGRAIGTRDYRKMGGLTETLAAWPEDLFGGLDLAGAAACRQVFLRLVGIDDAGRETRRRVALPELYELGMDPAAVDTVIEVFAAARLLTLDHDPLTRTPTVEVAHEALLNRWERLRSWMEEQRESLIMGRRFRAALAEWEHSRRDDEYLLRGGRLRQFEGWSRQSGLATTEAENEFLRRSRAAEEAGDLASRRRRRVVAAVVGALAVMAAGFGVVATVQRTRATDQRLVAEMQERIARARSLAASSAAQIDRNPELAVMLALESAETTRTPDGTVLREAEEALHAALTSNRLVSTVPAEMWTRTVAYAPDGDRYYVGGFLTGQVVTAPAGLVERDYVVPAMPEIPEQSHIAKLAVAGADGELLVVAHYSPGGVTVVDRAGLGTLFTLEGGCCWITDLAVGGGGTILAGVDPNEGLALVWDLTTRERIAEFSLDCPSGCPRGVALSDDGSVLTSGNTVWDVTTGEVLFSGRDASPSDVAMLDETRMILTDGPAAIVVDLESGETLQTLRGHRANIVAIDVAPDGVTVATGAQDGMALLWRLDEADPGPWLALPGHTGIVWEVRFSPDGQYLTTTAGRQQFPPDVVESWPRDWEVRTWDVSAGGIGELLAGATLAGDAVFGPDGATVVVAGEEGGAGVWELASGTNTVTFRGLAEDSRITAVAAASAGVALGGIMSSPDQGDAGWVGIFDPATGEMTTELVSPTPGLSPRELAFSADGSALAVAAAGLARVWDTTTWQVRFTPSDHSSTTEYTAVAFHPDPAFLFTQFAFDGASGAAGELWNLTSGEVMSTHFGHIPRGDLGSLSISPDGRMMVIAGDGRPDILEPFTGRALARLDAAPAQAVTAAFAPDGSRIATGESDGTVRLWNAATGAEELVLTGHTAQVVDVAFSPDGSRLVSVGLDGAVRVWALDVDDLISLARSRVSRGFTDTECRTYIGVGCAPSESVERLVPATAEWGEPYGITAATWDSAPSGGSWSELGASALNGGFVLDPVSRRLFSFNDPVDGRSVSVDLESGEVEEAATLWAPADPDLGGEEEPWPASANAMVYHPGLARFITTRAEDGATMAYDLDAGLWSELAPPHGPFAGRYGYGLAYDSESGLVVLFGGAEWGRIEDGKHSGLGDTWVFDAATTAWMEMTPDVSPPPRLHPGLVYDAASDRMVMFGGDTAFGGEVLGDTWAYDTNTNTWMEMTPSMSPPGRSGFAAWYDPEEDLVFVFGGTADASSYPPLPWMVFGGEELWGYDIEADAWTLYRVTANPGYRVSAWAGFDQQGGRAILAGGDGYDAERRYSGPVTTPWVYRGLDR